MLNSCSSTEADEIAIITYCILNNTPKEIPLPPPKAFLEEIRDKCNIFLDESDKSNFSCQLYQTIHKIRDYKTITTNINNLLSYGSI
jgi:hypothetical protein